MTTTARRSITTRPSLLAAEVLNTLHVLGFPAAWELSSLIGAPEPSIRAALDHLADAGQAEVGSTGEWFVPSTTGAP